MLPVPDDILRSFDALLKKKSVSQRLWPDYRKWLRYFLDFRSKYKPPDSRSEQVRQFIDKLRSKGQSQQRLNEAAQAVSLYFATQAKALPSTSKKGANGTKSVPIAPTSQRGEGVGLAVVFPAAFADEGSRDRRIAAVSSS